MTNRVKLTKTYIDRLSGDGFHWDTSLIGFGLRISGTTKTYIVQSRINGADKRRSIGRHGVFTPEQARNAARKALHEMSSGIDPRDAARARKIQGVTVSEVFVDYLARKQLKARTEADYRGYLSKYFEDWKDKPISAISADMIEARHAKLLRNHGAAQANVSMRCLRALFNFAIGKYQRADGSPLIAVSPTKRLSAARLWADVPRKTRFIKVNQLAAWHEAVCALGHAAQDREARTIGDYLRFLLFTGLRRQEAMELRWEHVDLRDASFTIPREGTKNGELHAVPLSHYTLALLTDRHAERENEFVFSGRGKSKHLVEPKNAIARVVAATGIEFSPHDLRRTFATCASTVIDNQATIKSLMNHKLSSQDVTEGYKQGVERLRGPAQRVSDYLLRYIISGPYRGEYEKPVA